MSIPEQDFLIPVAKTVTIPSDYVDDVTPKTNFMIPIGPSIWIVHVDTQDQFTMTIQQGSSAKKNDQTKGLEGEHDRTKVDDVECTSTGCSSSCPDSFYSPRNMVIVGLPESGGAWVWNPHAKQVTDELKKEIQIRCGGVRHLIVPSSTNLRQQPTSVQRLKEWSQSYPRAKVYAPPTYDPLADTDDDDDDEDGKDYEEHVDYPTTPSTKTTTKPNKHVLTFDSFLTDVTPRDYVMEIDQAILRTATEGQAIFFHRASRTILVGDSLIPLPTCTMEEERKGFLGNWPFVSSLKSWINYFLFSSHDVLSSNETNITNIDEPLDPKTVQSNIQRLRKIIEVRWKPIQLIMTHESILVDKRKASNADNNNSSNSNIDSTNFEAILERLDRDLSWYNGTSTDDQDHALVQD